MWVEPLLKMNLVVIFMFLHSSSLDSSTKSTSLKSDFKHKYICFVANLISMILVSFIVLIINILLHEWLTFTMEIFDLCFYGKIITTLAMLLLLGMDVSERMFGCGQTGESQVSYLMGMPLRFEFCSIDCLLIWLLNMSFLSMLKQVFEVFWDWIKILWLE